MEQSTIKKINSIKFRRISEEFNNTKTLNVIFQRVKRIIGLLINCKSRTIQKSGGEDETDIINIDRKSSFRDIDFKNIFSNNDIEAGAVIDLNSLEDISEITDSEFRTACQDASQTSHNFAKGFLLFEFLTKICDIILICVLPLYETLNLNRVEVISFLSFCSPIILLQVLCDWGNLSEKYQRLSCDFSDLSNSKADDRVDQYQKLVKSFKSDFIYADMIMSS